VFHSELVPDLLHPADTLDDARDTLLVLASCEGAAERDDAVVDGHLDGARVQVDGVTEAFSHHRADALVGPYRSHAFAPARLEPLRLRMHVGRRAALAFVRGDHAHHLRTHVATSAPAITTPR
jgi:hypothetical protein